uniref:Retrotransposon Copia-like N-terminal domain-containing protein n=1 Tax=Phaseolus vulgaris TaxID=3885 RepID=V7ASM7_PHAVU|nr:hypothetical protein PHAVU_009G035600g [Phaseolus vulgaris]ESW08315.1 hypothetical protein PHAVU_009G035600g [Phaseolus vulgaris]
MVNSSSLPSPSQFLPNSVDEKLGDSNYLVWKQQVEPAIKSHKPHRFVVNLVIPSRFLFEDDCASGIINPAYEDQILLSWLQSTLSKTILSYVLGVVHSYKVWEQIHDHFST